MPALIEHIDAIARREHRDVLYLDFHADAQGVRFPVDWHRNPSRSQVISWLDERGIGWQECGEFADEGRMAPYVGSIYLDVPMEENDPLFLEVSAYLENPDGSMRMPHVVFWAISLERALRNAHHDEPGFWERWAENL